MFLSGLMNMSSDSLFTILMVVLAIMLLVGLVKKVLWICVVAIVIFVGVGITEKVEFNDASHSVNMFINNLFGLEEDHFEIFDKKDHIIVEHAESENSDH